jgi:phosphoribosylanthranilate isomerase
MVKVKICGITNLEDAKSAAEVGADAIGFIFYKESPRYIPVQKAADIIRAIPPFVLTVGVFVNETPEIIHEAVKRCNLSLVQLHGDETPEFCGSLNLRAIKAIRVFREEDLKPIDAFPVEGILVDSYQPGQFGGTGLAINWKILKGISKCGTGCPPKTRPVILSGGLTPQNVEEAIETVSPYAVDVSSGVEKEPGKKDREKMKQFIQNARGTI